METSTNANGEKLAMPSPLVYEGEVINDRGEMISLTQARLRELLTYDPETGLFMWVGSAQASMNGKHAGCLDGKGRRVIRVDGLLYRASRLAWLWMTGTWPLCQIDHCDTDTSNDKWKNLRSATNSENQSNQGIDRKNTSGYKGVSWQKASGKWRAYINVNSKQIHLGLFVKKEDAAVAYEMAAIKYFGEFARAA